MGWKKYLPEKIQFNSVHLLGTSFRKILNSRLEIQSTHKCFVFQFFLLICTFNCNGIRSSIFVTSWLLFTNGKSTHAMGTVGTAKHVRQQRWRRKFSAQQRQLHVDGQRKSQVSTSWTDMRRVWRHQLRKTLRHFGVQRMLGFLQTQRTTKIDLSVSRFFEFFFYLKIFMTFLIALNWNQKIPSFKKTKKTVIYSYVPPKLKN